MKVLLLLIIIVSGGYAKAQDGPRTVYDRENNLTTLSSESINLSKAKDKYHSLDFTLSCSYPGQNRRIPVRINLNLVSVVKARKLNSDLYVVFIVDGKSIHFSSNRSAIRNPVQGRLWVGERMEFLIPYEEFLKLAAAEKLSVKLGGVEFEFGDEARKAVQQFAKAVKD